MGKKSQIQIGETIAVLFVFFILIVIGFVFYLNVVKGNLESEKEESSEIHSIELAQRVMFLPEIQCSEDVVKEKTNCIDILKLKSSEKIMKVKENEIYYYDLLEFSEVNVSQIYPSPTDTSLQNFNIYSRQTNDYKKVLSTNVPVSLYNPTDKRYSFGVLTIKTYSK